MSQERKKAKLVVDRMIIGLVTSAVGKFDVL
jgi:hypothetical protein